MWLTRLSINNPYFAAVLVLATVVLGFFSIFKLPVEAFPDVRFPCGNGVHHLRRRFA